MQPDNTSSTCCHEQSQQRYTAAEDEGCVGTLQPDIHAGARGSVALWASSSERVERASPVCRWMLSASWQYTPYTVCSNSAYAR